MRGKIVMLCIALCVMMQHDMRAANLPVVQWEPGEAVCIFPMGNYCRIIELHDGRLMATAETPRGIEISLSHDEGLSWEPSQVVAANPEGIAYAVPDLIQLDDHSLLIGFNPRPRKPYSPERRFGIRAVRSTDAGHTWSEPIFIFDASHLFIDGCWEPSFVQLPSGELHCYFANENEYRTSNEQCISLSRSFDGGKSWTRHECISFRAGHRDGMPVPILLREQREVVVIIEDNGWPGHDNFLATTVRTSLNDLWQSGVVTADSPEREFIFAEEPQRGIVSAAPYLRQHPSGLTLASYQGSEGRPSHLMETMDMFVLVGDADARHFASPTRPFQLDEHHHALWNSLCVTRSGLILAVASIGEKGKPNQILVKRGRLPL